LLDFEEKVIRGMAQLSLLELGLASGAKVVVRAVGTLEPSTLNWLLPALVTRDIKVHSGRTDNL